MYVAPGESVWLDITISREDPLWQDDVSASMLWLGDVFVQALQPWVYAETFRGTFHNGDIGRAVCFASAAPGEVLWVKTNLLESVSAATARALDFNAFCIANGIQLFGVHLLHHSTFKNMCAICRWQLLMLLSVTLLMQ